MSRFIEGSTAQCSPFQRGKKWSAWICNFLLRSNSGNAETDCMKDGTKKKTSDAGSGRERGRSEDVFLFCFILWLDLIRCMLQIWTVITLPWRQSVHWLISLSIVLSFSSVCRRRHKFLLLPCSGRFYLLIYSETQVIYYMVVTHSRLCRFVLQPPVWHNQHVCYLSVPIPKEDLVRRKKEKRNRTNGIWIFTAIRKNWSCPDASDDACHLR